jgi:hypothetical protein
LKEGIRTRNTSKYWYQKKMGISKDGFKRKRNTNKEGWKERLKETNQNRKNTSTDLAANWVYCCASAVAFVKVVRDKR